ncbi:MAG TPA: futalosine hydrolase [Trueperaceae bacterium]|nr:futalosine hydrolase [Trueperaceae bacterium]
MSETIPDAFTDPASSAQWSRGGPTLVIGATWFELAPLLDDLTDERAQEDAPAWPTVRVGRLAGVPVVITAGGIGKANTAAAIAGVHGAVGIRAVLQLGIGGAYPGPTGEPPLAPGSVAIAASEYDLDLGVGVGDQWRGLESIGFASVATDPPTYNLIATDPGSTTRAANATGSPIVPFATSDSVTSDSVRAAWIARLTGARIESMEGAAAAQVCLALDLPFLEIRAVSNEVGVRDKRLWRIHEAIAAAAGTALTALPSLSAA